MGKFDDFSHFGTPFFGCRQPNIVSYEIGLPGLDCQQGHVVSTHEECARSELLSALGLSFGNWAQTHTLQFGCLYNSNLHSLFFNYYEGGSVDYDYSPVCKTETNPVIRHFDQADFDTAACRHGNRIDDVELCREAARHYGEVSWQPVGGLKVWLMVRHFYWFFTSQWGFQWISSGVSLLSSFVAARPRQIFSTDGTYSGYPMGCFKFLNGDVYFNRHEGGQFCHVLSPKSQVHGSSDKESMAFPRRSLLILFIDCLVTIAGGLLMWFPEAICREKMRPSQCHQNSECC